MPRGATIRQTKLGEVLRKWRLMSDLTLEKAAKEMGISHIALHRLERGKPVPGAAFSDVLAWLLDSEDNGTEEKSCPPATR